MRPSLEPTLRWLLAVLSLMVAAGAHAAASSCPQLDYGMSLVPASHGNHIVIHANQASGSLGGNGVASLSGAVRVSQYGRELSASQLDYNHATHELLAKHGLLFRGPHFIIKSGQVQFNLNQRSGVFTHNAFTLPQRNSRGSAQRIALAQAGTAELDEAQYTTCSPGDESWILKAKRIRIDQRKGVGTAHDAVLWFQHIPLFYLPYFQFPTDGRRHTGLLLPSFGESGRNGFDVRVPLYLNLAPNFDDTFTPRVLTHRGVQLNNDFRYLFKRGKGSFDYHYMNHDRVEGHERSFIRWEHEELLSHRLSLKVDFSQVSDINYFDDFGGGYNNANGNIASNGGLATSSTPYLTRGAILTYHGHAPYTIQLQAQSYQPLAIITNPDNEPYKILPELSFNGITSHRFLNVGAGFSSAIANFTRSDSIQGQRLFMDPYLQWDLDHDGWYVNSRVDGTYTRYALSGPLNGLPESPQRWLPEYSLGGGLKFERTTASGLLQTLEPKVFYLYVPYRNQSDLPIFDTGLPDFDFSELFARNRYTGEDRIADANQVTSVLTSRLINPLTGRVRLSASFGQIYRFTAPRVALPGTPLPASGTSDYVGSIDYQLAKHWATEGTIQWSAANSHIARGIVALQYLSSAQQRLNIAYRYRQNLFNQADVSFVQPIGNRWHIAGRLIYSIRNSSSLEAFGGLEYETCCWAIRGGVRRYIANVSGKLSTGFFLQLTLKGLTSVGTGWGGLLPNDDNTPLVDRRNR